MSAIMNWWANLQGKWAFLFFAAIATLYGGSKGPSAKVSYPTTESGVRYLIDNGSYVTNDYIYIDFTRTVVPSSASLFIDRCDIYSTNIVDDTENFITSTFADFAVPQTVPCPNATNWNWYVYTDWTPGPAVQTNGVWEVIWMTDKKGRGYIIPARTVITENGKRISPNPAFVSDEDLKRYSTHKSVYIETLNSKE